MLSLADVDHVILKKGERFPWAMRPCRQAAVDALVALTADDPAAFEGAEIVTFADWDARHARQYLDQPARQITEAEWHDALSVLPPLGWRTVNGIERFNLSEFTYGDVTNQYARLGDRFCVKFVRVTDAATYVDHTTFASLSAVAVNPE